MTDESELGLVRGKSHNVEARAVPTPIARLGAEGTRRFFEFFTGQLSNANTRIAYGRAVRRLCDWCETRGLALVDLDPIAAAAYIEDAKGALSLPTLKQHLSAVRRLFNWWVSGGILAANPFSAIRLPRYSQRSGKTPVMFEDEVRALFDAIDADTILGLRDRALLGCMTYAFLRVSAVLSLRIQDYEPQARHPHLSVIEKGGKWQRIPCHHQLARDLDAYVNSAGLHEPGVNRAAPLFRRGVMGHGRIGRLTDQPLTRTGVLSVVKKYARYAELSNGICNHSFRATGITNYLANGGTLETAAAIANHASPQTTQLYNRNHERINQAELERIRF